MGINQLKEENIEGKRVANYRFNVYANFKNGEFKCLDVIWVISQSQDIAEELALARAKEMYEPKYSVSVMLTN